MHGPDWSGALADKSQSKAKPMTWSGKYHQPQY